MSGSRISPSKPWPAGSCPKAEDARLLAALAGKDMESSCCRRKMFDQPDQEAPNLADPGRAVFVEEIGRRSGEPLIAIR